MRAANIHVGRAMSESKTSQSTPRVRLGSGLALRGAAALALVCAGCTLLRIS